MKNRKQQRSCLLSMFFMVPVFGLLASPVYADEGSAWRHAMVLQSRVSQHAGKKLQQRLHRSLTQADVQRQLDGIRGGRIGDISADLLYRGSMVEPELLPVEPVIAPRESRLRFAGR